MIKQIFVKDIDDARQKLTGKTICISELGTGWFSVGQIYKSLQERVICVIRPFGSDAGYEIFEATSIEIQGS